MSKVYTSRVVKGDEFAYCQNCNHLPTDATRARVRQHVVRTGHVVRYIVERVTVYAPLAAQR